MSAELTMQSFGTLPDGRETQLFILRNKHGAEARVTNYGATLTALHAPDLSGKFANIVIGFDNLEHYLKTKCYYGASIGRYANRIAGGKFTLNGEEYALPINNNTCTLHGGTTGFDKMLWNAQQSSRPGAQKVELTYLSKHLEQGFPGNLDVKVTYTLTDDNCLVIDFHASCDRPTIINLTNHAYFNLHGAGIDNILDHRLMINADKYVPVDENLLPTGEVEDVAGTPFDFQKFYKIGDRINHVSGGYDHNFCFREPDNLRALKAEIRASDRTLRLFATQPGLQIFTSNGFDGIGEEYPYYNYSAFTLETQHFPDSINQPSFPSTVLNPGEHYSHKVTLDFSPN